MRLDPPPGRPLLLGHRGDPERFPENTQAAVAGALDAGADGVEVDVHLSRDGVAVVIHDATLARTTGHPGAVAERTWAELSRLDAGAWRGRPGEPIPRLEQVLELVRGRGLVAIELKEPAVLHPDLAATVLDLAAGAGVLDSMLLLAFDHAHLPVARARAPEVPTVALTVEPPTDPGTWLRERAAGVLGPLAVHVDAGLCDAVHAAGARVLAWTVDDLDRARQLAGIGCDVLVSNRPALLAPWLSRGAPAAGAPAPGRAGPRPSAGRSGVPPGMRPPGRRAPDR